MTRTSICILVVRLDDRATGEVQPLGRLPRAAFDAATAIAGRYGWNAPRRDDHERRREPRAARSLGVWHGERSLHSWVGEIAGPLILPRIDAAQSWADVGAALADYGLRYERTAWRGAVLADCSRTPPRKVPASALAFRASKNALEQRFGPTPAFPIPDDAQRNPRAFSNDAEGRSTGIATAAEQRAFVAEHATWTAVWLPVRDERLAAQRAVESSRKASLIEQVIKMRAVRDELAASRAEWLVANSFIRNYKGDAGAQLKAQASAERAALAELPFARRPPSRLLEWLRDRNGTVTETRLLHAPAATPTNAPAAPDGLRLATGLTGEAEWWTARRRVAIDRGNEIVVCDPTCLPPALKAAAARWPGVRVAGDQLFRDAALAAAATSGTAIDFDPRAEGRPALPVMPHISGHVGTRRAMAIARHIGAREIALDGKRIIANVADRRPEQPARATTLEISQADAVVVSSSNGRVTQMENAGFVPAVRVGETAIFALDRSVTSAERAAITRALLESCGGEVQRRFSLEGAIRYGPPGMCAGFERLLTSLRPRPQPVSFAERVRSIQNFFDAFVPEQSEPVVVATPVPQPKQAQTRKRGSRSR